MHLASNTIPVFLTVKQQGGSPDTRDTTDGTQASGTTADNDDIVVGLGNGGRGRESPEGEEDGQEGRNSESHGGRLSEVLVHGNKEAGRVQSFIGIIIDSQELRASAKIACEPTGPQIKIPNGE